MNWYQWLSLIVPVLVMVLGGVIVHAGRQARTQVVLETRVETLTDQLGQQEARHRDEINKIWTKFDEVPDRLARLEESARHVREMLTAIYHDVHMAKEEQRHDG